MFLEFAKFILDKVGLTIWKNYWLKMKGLAVMSLMWKKEHLNENCELLN